MIYDYQSKSGVIVPDTANVREEVANEFKEALGQDLDTSDSTPQGLLINAETVARQSVANNNALLANQINPNIAEGVFLDAIWGLTGGQRLKATKTLVYNVLLKGIPSTTIAEGLIVQSGSNEFTSISTVTLNAQGSASVTFQAVNSGAIACPINTLTQIITPVLGLESVNNPIAGVIGKEEESDQAARKRRRNTLALQGVALPEAIISNLYDLDGVKSLAFRENTANETAIIDGITMKPHSIWACINGGSEQDIAKTLLNTKSLGAGYNGNIEVNVIDETSGQRYKVQFDRPEEILIYIKVTVNTTYSSVDPYTAIASAIINYANGEQEGEVGFVVGSSISPFEISGAVNREYPSLFVKKVELSTDGVNYAVAEINIALDQLAITTEGLVSVVVE